MAISQPQQSAVPVATAAHPLDPLARAEIEAVVAIICADPRAPAALRFVSIELEEPSKQAVLDYRPGGELERSARAVLLDNGSGNCIEAVVSLSEARISSWQVLPHVQPAITPDEIAECERAVRRCPEYIAALSKRGVTDPELVMVDGWSAGHYGNEPSEDRRRRLVRA